MREAGVDPSRLHVLGFPVTPYFRRNEGIVTRPRPRRGRGAPDPLHRQLRNAQRRGDGPAPPRRGGLGGDVHGGPRRVAAQDPDRPFGREGAQGGDPRLDGQDPPPAHDPPRRRQQGGRGDDPGGDRGALPHGRQPGGPRPGGGQLRASASPRGRRAGDDPRGRHRGPRARVPRTRAATGPSGGPRSSPWRAPTRRA